jgi:Domain of unknown function (DUF5655)
MTPEEFFAESPLGWTVFSRVEDILDGFGTFAVRVTKSQVAFRRKRVFALLWMPGKWLSRPAAEVVLSIALGRRDGSERFKEVAHPTGNQWMHHLEIRTPDDLDREVIGWLREAADRAS